VIAVGEFDLVGLLAGVEAKAREMGAKRIVLDSLDVLLSPLSDPAAKRHEVYRVHDWLAQSGMTGLVSVRLSGEHPLLSQEYGFMQFMADCVVVLAHRIHDCVSLRTLQVAKYRGSGFSENQVPLLIGPRGIDVASPGTREIEYPVFGRRVSTGIEHLDKMLQGGYHQGSSVLVSGAPGTAKTTLAGAFVEAACQRGERALLLSFDEAADEIVRNLSSVSIDLGSHLSDGLLRIHAVRTRSGSAEEHLMKLRHWMDEYEPKCVVVDPLSALLKAGGAFSALSVAERLIYMTKERGSTLLCTSLLEGNTLEGETALNVSTIADTWIQLSNLAQGGERNRALSVIKSRGTGHSNQVRELLLSNDGPVLDDVYSAGGEVLMGTLRWERELTVEAERKRVRAEMALRYKELRRAEAEAKAQIKSIRAELDALHAAIDAVETERESREQVWREQNDALRERRRAGEV
jgi:circadian clock protein KaiC